MIYIIYRISIGDYTYIGSTRDFTQRINTHRRACKNKDFRVYQLIREAGGWDKCEMIPIEELECNGQFQARIREEYWRREYNANMNTIRAYLTEKEKIEQQQKLSKKSYEANKEILNVKHTCECGGRYIYRHKERHEKTKRHSRYLETQNLSLL